MVPQIIITYAPFSDEFCVAEKSPLKAWIQKLKQWLAEYLPPTYFLEKGIEKDKCCWQEIAS